MCRWSLTIKIDQIFSSISQARYSTLIFNFLSSPDYRSKILPFRLPESILSRDLSSSLTSKKQKHACRGASLVEKSAVLDCTERWHPSRGKEGGLRQRRRSSIQTREGPLVTLDKSCSSPTLIRRESAPTAALLRYKIQYSTYCSVSKYSVPDASPGSCFSLWPFAYYQISRGFHGKL